VKHGHFEDVHDVFSSGVSWDKRLYFGRSDEGVYFFFVGFTCLVFAVDVCSIFIDLDFRSKKRKLKEDGESRPSFSFFFCFFLGWKRLSDAGRFPCF
jgi:hypothetical protein